jgi:Uma2 family endonuclease
MEDNQRPGIRERAERYESIGGKVYDMSPSPTSGHQLIVGAIHLGFATGFLGTGCSVFVAPLDVWPTGESGEAVQPDVFVVCNKTKITDAGCLGAPDLIVEVLSPSTAKKDLLVKLDLYQRSAVGEFWVVDPLNQTIEAFRLQSSGYSRPDVYALDEDVVIPVGIKSGLELKLSDIFGGWTGE